MFCNKVHTAVIKFLGRLPTRVAASAVLSFLLVNILIAPLQSTAQETTTLFIANTSTQIVGLEDIHVSDMDATIGQNEPIVRVINEMVFVYDQTVLVNAHLLEHTAPIPKDAAQRIVYKSRTSIKNVRARHNHRATCYPQGDREWRNTSNTSPILLLNTNNPIKHFKKCVHTSSHYYLVAGDFTIPYTKTAVAQQVYLTPSELHHRFFSLPPPGERV